MGLRLRVLQLTLSRRRTATLDASLQLYNWHRPHPAISHHPPISRLGFGVTTSRETTARSTPSEPAQPLRRRTRPLPEVLRSPPQQPATHTTTCAALRRRHPRPRPARVTMACRPKPRATTPPSRDIH